MNAKWGKALIVSLAGIVVLAVLNFFVSVQQYRMASFFAKSRDICRPAVLDYFKSAIKVDKYIVHCKH